MSCPTNHMHHMHHAQTFKGQPRSCAIWEGAGPSLSPNISTRSLSLLHFLYACVSLFQTCTHKHEDRHGRRKARSVPLLLSALSIFVAPRSKFLSFFYLLLFWSSASDCGVRGAVRCAVLAKGTCRMQALVLSLLSLTHLFLVLFFQQPRLPPTKRQDNHLGKPSPNFLCLRP